MIQKGIRHIGWGLIFLLLLLLPGHLAAQDQDDIVINYTQDTAGDDTLLLDVYFTVVDEDGIPVPDPSVDSPATLILDDGNSYEAEVVQPQTEIYIVLVLDASGSMRQALPIMQEAARQAVDNAPENAQLAVIRFDNIVSTAQNFTTDRNLVKSVISGIQTNNGGTCLYDASFEALELTNQILAGDPAARRAVILFTDGRDELTSGQGDTCSTTPLSSVLNLAKTRDRRIPIYTIGLGGANVNGQELAEIAADTGGLSVFASNQENLSEQFEQIMQGLRNQWLAQAFVKPTQGEHTATLVVTADNFSGAGVQMSETFEFVADKDYSLAPAGITQGSVRRLESGDYELVLSLTTPEEIGRLEIKIKDENNIQVGQTLVLDTLNNETIIPLELANFEVGEQYHYEVFAFDPEGNSLTDDNGETLLFEDQFGVEPPPTPVPQALNIRLDPPTFDYEKPEMRISLEIVDAGNQIKDYRLILISGETGENIYSQLNPPFLSGNSVSIPLTDIASGGYIVRFQALDAEGLTLQESELEVAYEPPPPPPEPTFWQKAVTALGEQLWITLIIILLILGVVAYFMYVKMQQARQSATPLLDMDQKIDKGKMATPPQRSGSSALHRTTLFGRQEQDEIDKWENQGEAQKPPVAKTPRPDSGVHRAVKSPTLAHDKTEVDLGFVSAADGEMGTKNTAVSRYRLTYSIGDLQNKSVEIPKFPFTIGRQDCSLNIEDRRVSRKHAELNFLEGVLSITDQNSGNGTFLGEERLEAQKPYPLPGSNTQIRFGKDIYLTIEKLSD